MIAVAFLLIGVSGYFIMQRVEMLEERHRAMLLRLDALEKRIDKAGGES